MKQLLVYIRPSKDFFADSKLSSKIQIDNSLDLGWKRKDIIIVTNFPWEYNGVKAIVVGDEHFCAVRPRSIKTTIIPFLIEQGIIEKGELYWNHDFDAYQNARFSEAELKLEGVDVGLTDYGWRERWCLGSYFFKDSSKDIFEKAKEIIYKDIEDETAMMELTRNPEIAKRCKRLNITYNFGMRNVQSNYQKSKKPVRAFHFHPYDRGREPLNVFMRGKNGLNKPLMSKRLIKIFKKHKIN